MDFPFTVTDGWITRAGDRKLAEILKPFEGKVMVLSVKEAPKPRRPNKRKLYFSTIVRGVTKTMRDRGNVISEKEVHRQLKEDVGKLSRYVPSINGGYKFVVPSYMDLTPEEESEYLTICFAWCAEKEIPLPMQDNI